MLNPRGLALLVGIPPLDSDDMEAGAQKIYYLEVNTRGEEKELHTNLISNNVCWYFCAAILFSSNRRHPGSENSKT